MNQQPNLFNEPIPTPPPPSAERQRAMDAVLKKQNEAFKTTFRAFAIAYAETYNEFLAEEIRFKYQQAGLPEPTDWRASGGIIQSLVKENVLIETGRFRYCESGARQMMIYRGKG